MDEQKTPPTSPDHALEVRAGQYDSLYERVVKPDRALYLPGYFKHWVQYLGPDLAWMYASFRQAAYMDGGRSGETVSRIPIAEIAARAGIARRTYQNRAADPKTWQRLAGLVFRAEEEPIWTNDAGLPKQLPRKFTVAMTLPLTPLDTAALRTWLTDRSARHGAENALRSAAEIPLDELLPSYSGVTAPPQTIRAIVMELFGRELDAKLLEALSSAIQNHIMPPNDQIKITVFFMEHVLSHLGSGAGWVVTLLRDRCFDGEHETRNRVTVKNGYAEIASWLGVNRIKTVWEWLNMKKNGKFLNPILQLYLREVVDERDYDKRERTFHVLLEEIPNEALEALATGQGAIADLLAGKEVGASCTLGLAQIAPLTGGLYTPSLNAFAAQLGGICTHALAQMTPPFGGTCTHALAVSAPPLGADCAVKALKPQTQTLQTPPSQLTQSGRAGWVFSQLAQNNALNPKAQGELTAKFADGNLLAQKFIAWILYAHSPLGKGLTDASGVSVAVKKLAAGESAPRKFERLAALAPGDLRGLFDRDYARQELGKSPEAHLYRANFQRLDPARKSELYFALFGVDSPEPAPKKVEQTKTVLQIRLEQRRAQRQGGEPS